MEHYPEHRPRPMRSMPDGSDRHRFLAALRASGLSVEQLWLRYFGLGGEAGKVEIEAYLSGLLPLPPLQHDLLAHAINERLDELAPPRAPYSTDLPPSAATDGCAPSAAGPDGTHPDGHRPTPRIDPGHTTDHDDGDRNDGAGSDRDGSSG